MTAACAVVIACHSEKRWDFILEAVASVKGQTLPAAELILVVDHNPVLLARLKLALTGVTILPNADARGASGARNTGAAAASAGYLAFLDDDARAEPTWLAHLASALEDPSIAGAAGRVLPRWESQRPGWFPEEFDWVVGASYRGMPTIAAPTRNGWGESMAVRTEQFLAIGGFRSGFGKLGDHSRPEDTDMCIRLSTEVGGPWMYEPASVVWHHVPVQRTTFGFFIRRTYHEGRGKAELARLLPEPSSALSSERGYVLRTLPSGVLAHSASAMRRRRFADIGKAGAIVVGLGSTVWGYLIGSASERRNAHRLATAPVLSEMWTPDAEAA
jgi:GT2 family glycosyltransferase